MVHGREQDAVEELRREVIDPDAWVEGLGAVDENLDALNAAAVEYFALPPEERQRRSERHQAAFVPSRCTSGKARACTAHNPPARFVATR